MWGLQVRNSHASFQPCLLQVMMDARRRQEAERGRQEAERERGEKGKNLDRLQGLSRIKVRQGHCICSTSWCCSSA